MKTRFSRWVRSASFRRPFQGRFQGRSWKRFWEPAKGHRQKRRRAWRRGRRAEWLALGWLWLSGYRLIRRGYRCPQGEIDLILRRGRLLVFVEVKHRRTLADAAVAILPAQKRRITAAGLHFLQRHPRYGGHDLRFDALLLAPRRLPRHIAGVW